jgi:hypothetical protein
MAHVARTPARRPHGLGRAPPLNLTLCRLHEFGSPFPRPQLLLIAPPTPLQSAGRHRIVGGPTGSASPISTIPRVRRCSIHEACDYGPA